MNEGYTPVVSANGGYISIWGLAGLLRATGG